MKKILLLGGDGFLGKNIQKVFINSNYDVIIKSRRTGLDLLNYTNVIELLKEIKPDYIINAAAHVGGLQYVSKYTADIINDNLQMGLNLYKAIVNLDFKPIIINPIANCTYPTDIHFQTEEEWFNGKIHDSVLGYATARKTLFTLSECYEKQYRIKSINLIIPNAYGLYDYTDPDKVHALNGIIIRMINALNKGDKEFVIWGTGTPIREWIFMEDFAKIIYEVIDKNIILPNPINLGQEFGISIKETTETIKELLNYNVKLTFDTSKIDGTPVKIVSKTNFKKYFPDFVFTNYKEGIKLTLDYYKEILK